MICDPCNDSIWKKVPSRGEGLRRFFFPPNKLKKITENNWEWTKWLLRFFLFFSAQIVFLFLPIFSKHSAHLLSIIYLNDLWHDIKKISLFLPMFERNYIFISILPNNPTIWSLFFSNDLWKKWWGEGGWEVGLFILFMPVVEASRADYNPIPKEFGLL